MLYVKRDKPKILIKLKHTQIASDLVELYNYRTEKHYRICRHVNYGDYYTIIEFGLYGMSFPNRELARLS